MGECMGEPINSDEIQALKLQNEKLQAKVGELRERLAQSSGPVVKCGYLHKHRPWALRFLEKPWELRFFSLTNTTLSYWKSEAQAANHPRGKYMVDEDWTVRLEGMRDDGKHSVFVIEDSSGALVLRLSAGPEGEARSWVNALRSVGCTRVSHGEVEEKQRDSSDEDAVSSSTSTVTNSSSDLQESRNSASMNGLRQRIASFRLGEKDMSSRNQQQQQQQEQQQQQQQQLPQETLVSEKSLIYTLRPSVPAHRKNKESPLSSDAIFRQSHAGLFNLCIVVLVAVNSRLIIENLMKYGLLIQTRFLFSSKSLKDWPLLMCGLSLAVFPLMAYLIEKLKAHTRLVSNGVVWALHLVNLVVALLYPIYVIEKFQSDLFSGVVLMLIAVTGWLKLVSYVHTNADIRDVISSGGKIDVPAEAPKVEYPDNISLKNIAYFMMAPTLCYQLSYPRSSGVRKGWVLRQLGKLVVFNGFMGFIVGQYMNPIIKNSTHPLKGNYLYAIERVLKLSIPTLYVWLGFFYCYFHLWLNIVAEMLCFGDREFYKDWWNAKTIDEYWRLWNMPVHRWLVRHVYFPCLRLGIHKQVAVIIVFVISGIFHEICIAVPCHMLRGWAFLGIMLQVPLVVLTNYLHKKFQSPMLGNMIFWFLFCIVGQPMSVLVYYHDVVNRQQLHASSSSICK